MAGREAPATGPPVHCAAEHKPQSTSCRGYRDLTNGKSRSPETSCHGPTSNVRRCDFAPDGRTRTSLETGCRIRRRAMDLSDQPCTRPDPPLPQSVARTARGRGASRDYRAGRAAHHRRPAGSGLHRTGKGGTTEPVPHPHQPAPAASDRSTSHDRRTPGADGGSALRPRDSVRTAAVESLRFWQTTRSADRAISPSDLPARRLVSRENVPNPTTTLTPPTVAAWRDRADSPPGRIPPLAPD